MAVSVRSEVVQVTNISPSATSEQMRTLFGHIGVLEEFVIYPPDDREEPASKVCYIRYQDAINAEVALHLNNTVFLDRALIVLPLAGGHESIPDEKYANLVRAPPNTAAGVLPRTADWPLNVISMVVGRPGEQVIQTLEPRLSSLSFPLYPPLPATTDGSRIEEIRRTILVTNLDPKTTGDQVLDFFNKHAEVRCVRMAGTEFDRAAYVEFTQQPSIVKAFGLMGCTLNGRQIMIQHSNCAIIKPANNLALLDDASKRNATDQQSSKDHGSKHSDRGRTRSRSRDRRSRSRRRSTSRRRRSRSRDRRRSRSRSHRSYGRRRSRTRSRSRSRNRRRYSRSRSRDRRRSDRGRSRSRNHRRYRSRSRSGRRYSSRSRSRGRRDDRRVRDKDRMDRSIRDRNRDKDRDRNKDSERRDKDREKTRHRDRERERSRDRTKKPREEESAKSTADSTTNGAKETVDIATEDSKKGNDASSTKSRRASSGSSYNSGSENESNNESVLENKQPIHNNQVNGDNEENDSQDPPNKPTVVGVKLAGPEDMDHLATETAQIKAVTVNDLSPANSDSSGDAMDTEA